MTLNEAAAILGVDPFAVDPYSWAAAIPRRDAMNKTPMHGGRNAYETIEAQAAAAIRLPRPNCRGIDPEAGTKGYYCTNCGYSLIETKSGWFRHGGEWIKPEVWTQRR